MQRHMFVTFAYLTFSNVFKTLSRVLSFLMFIIFSERFYIYCMVAAVFVKSGV